MMKTILLTMVVWALTGAVSYAQVRASDAIRKGSAESLDLLEQTKAMFSGKMTPKEAKRRKKAAETGRSLFGTDKQRPKGIDMLKQKYFPDFKVGDWGYPSNMFRVISKVSNTECLVMPESLRRRNNRSEVMLLRGLDMSKVTDGVEFILQHPIVIPGTYSYTAVSGAKKTVLVLECNDSKLDDFIAKARKQAEAKHAAAEANQKTAEANRKVVEVQAWQERWNKDKHTWTDKSGKYSVEAIYDGYLGEGKIRLLRKDKSELVIHLSKLSEPDRRKAVALRRAGKQAE